MKFDHITGAAETAFARIDRATQSKSPDLMLYDKLSSDSIKKLEDLYGTDQVKYYIQEMEAKRRVSNVKVKW